ncbi:MAG: NADH-quinone oxidoreductase subunit [Actinomycetota bacterium]|nr:NADH-quinone oxidoreductase subunit [Actinomycetota bacterium]
MAASGEPIRFTLDWGAGLSLSVHNLGLACCAIEVVAASLRREPPAATAAAGRRTADVLVVSGTVTDQLAPSVLRVYAGFDPAPYVMSFGACSNSGGPYWDSYSVTKGVDQLIPVDVYVPGCPPRPEAFVAALRELEQRMLR